MEDGKASLVDGITKIPVEITDVRGSKQALVDDGSARGRRNREPGELLGEGPSLDVLPSEEEVPFDLVLVETRHLDDDLLDERHGSSSPVAEHGRVGGNRSPCEDLHVLERQSAVDQPSRLHSTFGWQEDAHHREPVASGRLDTASSQFPLEEPVRQLREDSGPVSGSISCLGAPMVQATEAVHAEPQDSVGGLAVSRREEADATSVVMLGSRDEGPRSVVHVHMRVEGGGIGEGNTLPEPVAAQFGADHKAAASSSSATRAAIASAP